MKEHNRGEYLFNIYDSPDMIFYGHLTIPELFESEDFKENFDDFGISVDELEFSHQYYRITKAPENYQEEFTHWFMPCEGNKRGAMPVTRVCFD